MSRIFVNLRGQQIAEFLFLRDIMVKLVADYLDVDDIFFSVPLVRPPAPHHLPTPLTFCSSTASSTPSPKTTPSGRASPPWPRRSRAS